MRQLPAFHGFGLPTGLASKFQPLPEFQLKLTAIMCRPLSECTAGEIHRFAVFYLRPQSLLTNDTDSFHYFLIFIITLALGVPEAIPER